MRVLAIIPACEGSVTLPNKNVRVIQGKPMIYYVIDNAKRSKYITDVIVTSNSNEIIALARQMRVMTRHRRAELSNATVSLDEVVWDVFEQLDIADYDYIVTMQSISPLLKVDTLDRAFERFIKEGLDSLISVKNQSQFFWEMSENVPIPLQKERMNRHQLPPFYMETGAFLITKSQFITKKTRLGPKVGIFELTGDEAIDVNNFADLELVENAMSRKSAAIYVNGNNKIGLGHISRVFQVADELFTKPDIYYDDAITDRGSFGKTTYNVIPVNGDDGFVREMTRSDYDIIINDVLDTSEKFMKELRAGKPFSRIINFEDSGTGAEYADIVINALYEQERVGNIYSGSNYYIIPKMFLLYDPITIRDRVENVIITFGGADPRNFTEYALKVASEDRFRNVRFYIVLGKANKNKEAIINESQGFENVKIMVDIDNIAEIMSYCDIAISSRGRTCFELAALGIPTLSIAQHEREELHTFVSEKNGFMCLPSAVDEEMVKKSIKEIIDSPKDIRFKMQEKMLANDLRNGRKNVAGIIQNNNR